MHKNWERHPLSELWGDQSDELFKEFVEDVRVNGVHDPIVRHPDGRVLEGWHRYQAAILTGRQPPYVTLPEGDDPVAYVISKNAMRRTMTKAQRVACILAARNWAPAGRPRDDAPDDLFTRQEIADTADASLSMVSEVKRGIADGFGEDLRKGTETPHSLRKKRKDSVEPGDDQQPLTRMEKLIAENETLKSDMADLRRDMEVLTGQLRLGDPVEPDVAQAKAEGLEVSLRRTREALNKAKMSNNYLRAENKKLLDELNALREPEDEGVGSVTYGDDPESFGYQSPDDDPYPDEAPF